MKHYISILLFVTLCAICSCTSDTDPVNMPPTVTTGDCKSTTRESAQVEGTIVQNGSSIDSYGIVYSTNSQMLVDAKYMPCEDVLNATSTTFSTLIPNLTSGRTYFYRTYVKSGGAYYYGDFKTFSTPTVSAPTFSENTNVIDIEANEAKLTSLILDEGFGKDITYLSVSSTSVRYKKVAEGTTPSSVSFKDDNTWSSVPASYDKATKKFEGTMTGLAPNTTYAACAYAASAGYNVSNVVVFTTKDIPTDLPQVSAVTYTKTDESGLTINIVAQLISEGSDPVTTTGFVYSTTNAAPQVGGQGCTTLAADVDFRASLNNLPHSTTYYIRAYADNKNGRTYGEVLSYTTPDVTYVPSVLTVTTSNVTSNSAVLVGYLNSNNVNIASLGFIVDGQKRICNVMEGTFSIELKDLKPETTYTFSAFCVTDKNAEYKGSTMTFTTSKATPSSEDIDFPGY